MTGVVVHAAGTVFFRRVVGLWYFSPSLICKRHHTGPTARLSNR